MDSLIKLLAKVFREKADALDAGNSNLTEEEVMSLLDYMQQLSDKLFSKELACSYLNMSRSVFDTHIRNKELPEGKKIRGFKEKSWNKTELDKAVALLKNR